jgi:hypothetical protein
MGLLRFVGVVLAARLRPLMIDQGDCDGPCIAVLHYAMLTRGGISGPQSCPLCACIGLLLSTAKPKFSVCYQAQPDG